MASLMKTTEYLVHLIDCSVNGKKPNEKPNDISFDDVFRLGKAHCVAGIAYLSIKKLEIKPEKELLVKWESNYYNCIKRSVSQQNARNKIIEAFKKKKIRSLEFKGTVIKNLYPQPELRFMTDIDFVVDRENLSQISEICEGLGYIPEKILPYERIYSVENKFSIEFHTDYFSPDSLYSKVISNPFSEAEIIDDGVYAPNDSDFYLYNLLHFAKHLESGCGIRQVLDLYFLDLHFSGLVDKLFIKSKLQVFNDFEKIEKYIRLSKKWFGGEAFDENFSEEIKYTALSGLTGNSKIMLKNQMKKDAVSGKKFVRLRRGVGMIFQPKEVIYAEYPVCCERGYSTPMCWAYRLGSTVSDKEKRKRISGWIKGIKDTKID